MQTAEHRTYRAVALPNNQQISSPALAQRRAAIKISPCRRPSVRQAIFTCPLALALLHLCIYTHSRCTSHDTYLGRYCTYAYPGGCGRGRLAWVQLEFRRLRSIILLHLANGFAVVGVEVGQAVGRAVARPTCKKTPRCREKSEGSRASVNFPVGPPRSLFPPHQRFTLFSSSAPVCKDLPTSPGGSEVMEGLSTVRRSGNETDKQTRLTSGGRK